MVAEAAIATGLPALDQLLGALEDRILPPAPRGKRHYPYIPLPIADFLAGLGVIGPAQGRSFLDVGCGIGSKLLLAQRLGWQVAGFDRHAPYLELARELVPEAALQRDRAETFTGYHAFDVVYSYRLCVEDDDQAELEQRIVERMRPGAIAWFPYGSGREHGRHLGCSAWRLG